MKDLIPYTELMVLDQSSLKEVPGITQAIPVINLKRRSKPLGAVGRTGTKVKLVFWSSDTHRQLIGKVLMPGRLRAEGEEGIRAVRWLDGITSANGHELTGKLREMGKDPEA